MLGQLARTDRTVVADFEAGLGTVLRMDAPVDVVVVVVEPTAKSLDVGQRAADSVTASGYGRIVVVANRVRDDADAERVRAAFPDAQVFLVPDEPAVVAAERQGVAPLDAAPESPGVRALIELGDHLVSGGSAS